MSDLAEHAENYLTVRRALGFRLVGEGRLLAEFVAFADKAGQRTVTTQFALEWARRPASGSHNYLSRRLRAVRGFAAIRLDRDDVDLDNQVLTVRDSKFGKSREVLLHPSTVHALVDYDDVRDRLCPRPKERSFFITTRGTRLCHPTIYQPFRRLLDQAGVRHPAPPRRVRIHDLRH